jgi:cyclopropane fatty-acyl-phospholipid synthase-like methyltransferase
MKMKHLKTFERFGQQTLKNNNNTYNDYYQDWKSGRGDRNDAVAWSDKSQIKNYNLVAKYIKSGESVLDYGCGIGDFNKYLKSENIIFSDYLGVDINPNFIETAKSSYPNINFQLISKVRDIKTPMDNICAIGVFTWFITKRDFIDCINYLYELCNKQILITCLYDEDINNIDWRSKYRYYNEYVFEKLFPQYKMEFDVITGVNSTDTMLVRIIKN